MHMQGGRTETSEQGGDEKKCMNVIGGGGLEKLTTEGQRNAQSGRDGKKYNEGTEKITIGEMCDSLMYLIFA